MQQHIFIFTRWVQEFCRLLIVAAGCTEGQLEVVEARFADYSLPEKFSTQHSAIQYAALFLALSR